MARIHGWTISAGALALALLAAGSAEAGASGGATSTGSTSGSGSGCGCVPTTHQVRVPGVEITAPSVTVNLPTLNVVSAGGSAYANANSSANANASISTDIGVSVSGSNSSNSNAQAIINSAAFSGGGGGGSWSDSGSVSTTIDNVKVETPVETRRICALFKSEMKTVAIQANCLDDKDVPHPASQLSPTREVDAGFEGEIYRCIAGSRMQYAIAEYSGQADFGHGQTFTCGKGEALYHSPMGGVQCRAQKPARDCNERSLLRRFGAGIKILKIERKDICAEWRTVTVQANASD